MKPLSQHKTFRCGKQVSGAAIALLLVLASVEPAPGHSVIVHEAITAAAITSTMSQAQNYKQFLNKALMTNDARGHHTKRTWWRLKYRYLIYPAIVILYPALLDDNEMMIPPVLKDFKMFMIVPPFYAFYVVAGRIPDSVLEVRIGIAEILIAIHLICCLILWCYKKLKENAEQIL